MYVNTVGPICSPDGVTSPYKNSIKTAASPCAGISTSYIISASVAIWVAVHWGVKVNEPLFVSVNKSMAVASGGVIFTSGRYEIKSAILGKDVSEKKVGTPLISKNSTQSMKFR